MNARESELERYRQRLQIVEGLLTALADSTSVLEIIASSEDIQAARDALMREPWSFSESVAQHVLDMPYRRTTKLTRNDLEAEANTLRRQIDEIDRGPTDG